MATGGGERSRSFPPIASNITITMTVPTPASNFDDFNGNTQHHHWSGPLDPIEDVGDEPKRQTADTKRDLPVWAKEQISQWGERLTVPEWDADEDLGGSRDDNIGGRDEIFGGGRSYRSKNGWKVGSCSCNDKCIAFLHPFYFALLILLFVISHRPYESNCRAATSATQYNRQLEYHITVSTIKKAGSAQPSRVWYTLHTMQNLTPGIVMADR